MRNRVFVIGASDNGTAALSALMARLPANLPASFLVIQHNSPDGPGQLPDVLGKESKLPVAHARDLELIEPGRVYVAPPDRHLLVRPGGYLSLSHGPKENNKRPAVDPTLRSAALVFGSAAVGIVLTGQLDDGTAGLVAIKSRGGVAIAQEPHEAAVPSMPLSAIRHAQVDHCANIEGIAALIVALSSAAPSADRHTDSPLLEYENLMAQGPLDIGDWSDFERLCQPAGMSCPACRGVLWEFRHVDQGVPCYRCRSGHGFTARSLLAAHAQARSDVQAELFAALTEEAALLRRMLDADPLNELPELSGAHETADVLERHAAEVTRWMAETAAPPSEE